MFDYLTDHALKNVWCSPEQDNQYIVKPPRITGTNGALNTLLVDRRQLKMPEPLSRFHVYQFGQIHPVLLNLFAEQEKWITMAEACNVAANIVDIYNTDGIQYPRHQVWYYLTRERNVLMAVKRQPKLPLDFNALDLYLRVYDNQYYAHERSQPINDYVEVKGKTALNTDDLMELQAWYSAKEALPGAVYAFVNGRKVPRINLVQAKVGDVVEGVYDSSIQRVIDYPIAALKTFDSNVDNKGKYLLHHRDDTVDSIDFQDDIDVFVINHVTGKGVYLHKNPGDTLRNLTHRDYSVPVAYVQSLFHHFLDEQGGLDISKLSIRLHIRKGGWYRPLVFEHHRIYDLYQLPHPAIEDVMLGLNSVVPVWRADALEESWYVKLMGVPSAQVNQDLVQKAYGYNATSVLVADTPMRRRMDHPLQDVVIPYLLAFDSTVYEYDTNGLLLEWHRHTHGFSYIPRNAACRYVEAVMGRGTRLIDDNDDPVVPLTKHIGYRYYLGDDMGSGVTHWRDVTGTSEYAATDFQAQWLNTGGEKRLVRSDKTFLAYEFEQHVEDGLLAFHLTKDVFTGLVNQAVPIDVPLGELDLWLNGHPVIEGLDWHVKDGFVVVCNRDWLVSPTTDPQRIAVRWTGFCQADLQPTPKNEFGFVIHGKVSVNNRYNIHEGKVQRIICGGRLHHRDEMKFSEATLTYEFDDADNGKPYLIRDHVVPLREVVSRETYAYRAESLVVDKQVEDYLTLLRPEDPVTEVNPIAQRYHLFSPFLCKIIVDLYNGVIPDNQITEHYSDERLHELVAPYLYLFERDPLHIEHLLDPQYVVIYPHFLDGYIDLSMVRTRFIRRVVALYGNNRVNLSSFIRMV